MNVQKYITDEVFEEAGSPTPEGDFAVEELLKRVLPGILAAHRADVLLDIARDCLCMADHDLLRAEATKAVTA